MVAKNNQIVFNKSYGTIAGAQSPQVTNATLYDLASMAFEDTKYSHAAVQKWLEGKLQASGTLPVTISPELQFGTLSEAVLKKKF